MKINVHGESTLDLGNSDVEAGDVIIHTTYMLVIAADTEKGEAKAGILNVDVKGLKINETIARWMDSVADEDKT